MHLVPVGGRKQHSMVFIYLLICFAMWQPDSIRLSYIALLFILVVIGSRIHSKPLRDME